ncbi:MAG: BlaI/MecI/CopY family transcriptional regulator [Roseburia sp.]
MNENRLQDLSRCEQTVMAEIWRCGKAESRQIREILNAKGIEWKPQTVCTFIRRLQVKGYLDMQRSGRHIFYIPVVKCEDYVQKLTEDFKMFCKTAGLNLEEEAQ